jgi:anthranilate phosphoribosyltransferase
MIKDILTKLSQEQDLSYEEMQDVVNSIMSGEEEDVDIENFLLSLNKKGIKEPEITAAATVMREKSLKFDIGDGTHIDTCGTGGTGLHTFNCSTASSFVAAAGGASITKHGNKAISSKSGSADFLTEAGADITHDRNKLLNVFNQVGFIFLFAPLHHASMKYVMPARQRIGKKTIFNLLGPHTNPCGARRQIIGVYDKSLLSIFSKVARNLDMEHVMVVHGEDGLDEISITGPTHISEYKDYKINESSVPYHGCKNYPGSGVAPNSFICGSSYPEYGRYFDVNKTLIPGRPGTSIDDFENWNNGARYNYAPINYLQTQHSG